ncbi:MAG: GrpB family protein [Psychromonas sp.]
MKVEVVDYDPNWLSLFEQEKLLLMKNSGSAIDKIHHIGSTSIVGLSAKPIIDIIIEAKSLASLDNLKVNFENLGYEVIGELMIF